MTRLAHRTLRRLLPLKFRTRHGQDMESLFLEAMADAWSRGWRSAASLWLREIADIADTAHRLRRTRAVPIPTGHSDGRRASTLLGLRDDVRFAVRSLARGWSLALFAVITLALGIGGATAMYGAVESIILNPLPYEAGNRIVGAWQRIGTTGEVFVGAPREARETWAEQTDLFEHFEPFTFRFMELTGASSDQGVSAALVRPAFYEILGRTPIMGRVFDNNDLAGDGLPVVVLNEGFWRTALGARPDVLGTSITLDGRDWTVIGVMPAGSHVPSWGLRRVDVWRPLTEALIAEPSPSSAVMRQGVTTEMVNARLANLAARDPDPEAPVGHVALLLIIACVNVSSLLVSRARRRQRETAVRSALGAGRGRLVRQLVVESSLLALAGGMAGIGVAHLIRSAIGALRPAELAVLDQVAIGSRVLWFALAGTTAAALVLGCLPAWRFGSGNSLISLRSGDRTNGNATDQRLRWLLVTGEVALSFALVLGSVSVFGTLLAKLSADPGFETAEILYVRGTARSWEDQGQNERELLALEIEANLAALPGVAGVTRISRMLPNPGALWGEFEIEGSSSEPRNEVFHGPSVEPEYFDVVGQPILNGRGFAERDLLGTENVVVISESTAGSLFPDQDAVGARFRLDETSLTVIGVVSDVPMLGLGRDAPLQAYRPLRTYPESATFAVRVAPGSDLAVTLGAAQNALWAVNPDLDVLVSPAAERLERTLGRHRFAVALLSAFAGLALGLSALGLYGAVSNLVGQRTRELGVRMALGARRQDIVKLVLGGVGYATIAGIAAGAVLVLTGGRVVDANAFGREAISSGTYVVAALVLATMALAGAALPAWRAARVEPVEAIRD